MRLRALGLRVRLIGWLAIALLPILALTFYAHWEQRNVSAAVAKKEAGQLARATAVQDEDLIQGTQYESSPLYERTAGEQVYMVVGIPTSAIYSGGWWELAQDPGLSLMVVALASAVLWHGGYRAILAPARKLIAATEMLAAGNLSARANGPHWPKEMRRLAQAFNTMAQALQERQNRLEQAEAKYRRLVEQLPDVFYTATLDDACSAVYVSPQIEKMLGYTAEEWTGRPDLWAQRLHPDDRQRVLAEVAPAGRTGGPFSCEYRLLTKDKQEIWVLDEAVLVKDQFGKPRFRQGTMQDISQRKHAEQRLQRMLLLERTVAIVSARFVSAGDLGGAIDASLADIGRVSEADRAYLFLLSDGGTLISNTHEWCADGIAPQNGMLQDLPCQVLPWWLARLRRGETIRVDNVSQMPAEAAAEQETLERRGVHAVLALPVSSEGHVVGFLGLDKVAKTGGWSEDDTSILHISAEIIGGALSRQQAAKLLMESEERYRQLVELSPMPIIVHDGNRYLFANTAAAKLYGASGPEDLVTVPVLDTVHTDYKELVRERARLMVEERRAVPPVDLKNVRLDGSVIDVEIAGIPILHENRPAVQVVIHDVTERNQAREAIRREAARARTLARVAARSAANIEIEVMLNVLCEETAHAFEVPAASIYLYDQQCDQLRVAATFGLPPVFREQAKPISRIAFDAMTKQSEAVAVYPDVRTMDDYQDAELCATLDIRTLAVTPVAHGTDLLGALAINTFGQTRELGDHERQLLQALAGYAALAIANAQLHADNARKLAALTVLYATAKALSKSLDVAELTKSIVNSCVDTFGARLAWLSRAEPDGSVCLMDHSPKDSPYPQTITARWDDTPPGQGPIGQAIRSGSPVVVRDLTKYEGHLPWGESAVTLGLSGAACFPLVSQNNTFGALVVCTDRLDFFDDERVELLHAYAHQAAAALQNAHLYEAAERRLSKIQALRSIDMAISGSLDLRVTLNVLLDQVVSQLDIDAASVLLLNPHSHLLEYAAGRGFGNRAIVERSLHLGEGYPGQAALQREPIVVADLARDGLGCPRASLLREAGFTGYWVVPLISKGHIKGVLEVLRRGLRPTSREWEGFLEALAGQAAIAIDSAALFDELQRSNANLALAYDATIEGWSRALDLRDDETEGHSQRVAEVTLRLGKALGLGEDELAHLRRGALLHDIGKMGIPDSILLKPGSLTEEERKIMRKHPVYAYELLSPIAFMRPALDIPYCHHEKWDGSGYPRGLKGDQIPLSARLFAVADVWDALRSDRPYRKAWSAEKARAYIHGQSGKHFDPKVVSAFLDMT